jgi:quinol monooxygenase YgiN
MLAFFKAKPGMGKELEQILLTLVPPTRTETGNIAYFLHRSTENSYELMFDEIFSSSSAFIEQRQKPYIKSLESRIE